MPGTVLGTEDTIVNKTKIPSVGAAILVGGKQATSKLTSK